MSKLEPTRTYSNPTATDIVRRLLDERGVEYEAPHAGFTIVRTDNNDPDGFCAWGERRDA